MPELLLEILSEEIPARMQVRAADNLKRMVTDALVEAGCVYEGARAFATPRRLVLSVEGLPASQPDLREERKGPRVDAPDKAIDGFLGSVGMTRDQLETREDKKGTFYVAQIERPGRPTPDVVAELVPDIVHRFPWPKSMRWGTGTMRWVRPLHSIVCTFDGEVVDFEIEGIAAGRQTRGHRFMGPEPIEVRRFEDYETALENAHVMLDTERRAASIATDAKNLVFAQGLELAEDDNLLQEVAGLVEWPVVLMGEFDPAFLDVPHEVLTSAMRTHQKYFTVKQPDGGLAAKFVMVSNLVARDGGKAIVAGNERVLNARLSDAKFFWDQDKRASLESRLPALNTLIFHAKLGSVHDKAHAVARLAMGLAAAVSGADKHDCETAALLAKTDLVTEMVGEFPELQGLMGRYYALNDNLAPHIAEAIGTHYAPQGPSDAVPSEPTAIVVALADKLHTIVGFFGIDEKPTGSKDPYALRRTALGIIRLILENEIRLPLNKWFGLAARVYAEIVPNSTTEHWMPGVVPEDDDALAGYENAALMSFFADRLKVYLRDRGARHDLIDAIFALGGQDDLVLIVRRVETLGTFLDTEDGGNLLAGIRRAANILRIEEKKDARSYDGEPDPALFVEQQERALADAITTVEGETEKAVAAEDYAAAMSAFARLRGPVDAFFDGVTVNSDDGAVRENRLKLLSGIRAATRQVADFSKIEG